MNSSILFSGKLMATNPVVPSVHLRNMRSVVNKRGFAVVDGVIDSRLVQSLIRDLEQLSAGDAIRQRDGRVFGIRHLLNVVPSTNTLLDNSEVSSIAKILLGKEVQFVRGLFFDKTPQANWKVIWHQDLTIAVRQRQEVSGFGPWTIKAGIPHVQPPTSVLEGMIALRIHLDEATESNGALKVLPGSHLLGRLSQSQIEHLTNKKEAVVCNVTCGGVLVMRPLLLHSSSTCSQPTHRRVIHLEFAGSQLPGGLEWANS
jgi:ectoine hydroxylase-related dioxygenase (phytanoyl-CoA dioxygenase family)